jgi:UDP-N-acetylglucosamine--N-acetylmuramyl-(pentapeptide) pyrophosphoryl-undecaprenol N-acetylglucosamine transferase
LPVRGLKGRGLRGLREGMLGVPKSIWRSLGIIRRFRPHCIIGLGGYASGPLLLAGVARRVRCAVMEQNVRPGLTNRVLGWLVARVFTSYAESDAYFPKHKVVLAGTPVRWNRLPDVRKGARFTLLVFGGSAGAHRLNVVVLEALALLGDLSASFQVVHQTGNADLEEVKAAYASLPCEAEVLPFIDRMDEAYAAADLVVCRAGASTLSEVCAFGRAAILVPYPYAVHDHQRVNAQALCEAGAAEMILEAELSGEVLAHAIRRLCEDEERRKAMGQAASRLAQPEAAARIVDECYALVAG